MAVPPCIYALSCSCSPHNFRYVGQTTKGAQYRLEQGHLRNARGGGQLPVHFWIRKHIGLGHTIGTSVIATCDAVDLNFHERSMISALHEQGFDLMNCGVNDYVPMSEVTRAKLAAAQRGKKASPESRDKRRQAMLGRTFSAETIAKMSAIKTGKSVSDETRAKMSASSTGRPVSEAARAKIRAARAAEKERRVADGLSPGRSFSDETRAKISRTLSSKTLSEEEKTALVVQGKRGSHNRWHVNRGIVKPDCAFCS